MSSAAEPETSTAKELIQALPPFKLERYFARWEFCAPHLLCCSDCEPLRLPELLTLADADSRDRWENLRLGYGETRGMPELRQEISKLYDKVEPEGVIVGAPQECIYLAMLALLRPGDHVVVTYPGYQSLHQLAASMGCLVALWEAELREDGGAHFDVARLQSLLRPHTRLVVVNFPHNPTGALLRAEEWASLVGCCRAVDCHLFSDEMYRGLELDPAAQLPSAVDVYDKAITLSGLSKTYGLPGLRVGWLAVRPACLPLLDRVAELKDWTTICNSQPSELLALMALRARAPILARNLALLRSNLAAVAAFMADFSHMFGYCPPVAGSVAFPRLLLPASGTCGGEGSGGKDCQGDTDETAATAATGATATGATANAADDDDIEGFCDRVVQGCGVMLLPATVYDHAPSAARGHFRIGLGRRDLPTCLEVLRGFLTAQQQQPQQQER